MNAVDLIRRHEGLRLSVYNDTRGFATIGYGRNLQTRGISPQEALMLFQRDYQDAMEQALRYPWYNSLSEPRQAVVIDMLFEMGPDKFKGFKGMIAAIAAGDFERAALEMVNSAWYREVPERAEEDANIMRSGQYA